MNIDIIGKFYLGNGGIGDALIFLSTFYDDVEEANVIFLANNPAHLSELFDYFPKIKKKLIIPNSFSRLTELYHHPNCIGTGILPKNLDYSTWYKVNIFKEYGVKEFPDFMNLFEPLKASDKKQMYIQSEGSATEGDQKKRMLSREVRIEIDNLIRSENYHAVGMLHRPLVESIRLIRGSDLVIGVDSFAKTVSAMSRIPTIVYDNMYSPLYLERFKDRIDYGHYVFIFPWSYIEFRSQ